MLCLKAALGKKKEKDFQKAASRSKSHQNLACCVICIGFHPHIKVGLKLGEML